MFQGTVIEFKQTVDGRLITKSELYISNRMTSENIFIYTFCLWEDGD